MIKKIYTYLHDFGVSCIKFGLKPSWKIFILSRLKSLSVNERDTYISNVVSDFLWDNFSYIFNKPYQVNLSSPFNSSNSPVWVFWWQGEHSMPPIVKACYKTILKYSPDGHPVLLLTKSNFQQYTDIPTYILNNLEKNIITLAHFSDILRLNLLSIHGGMWLDATMYITRNISPGLFEKEFFSPIPFFRGIKYHDVSWSVFAQGGKRGNKIHTSLYLLFTEYWIKFDKLINYILIDDAIRMIYKHFPDIKETIDNGGIHTTGLFELQQVLGEPFDENYYNKLIKENTFHKLTYKRGNIIGKENPTFYDHIVSEIK